MSRWIEQFKTHAFQSTWNNLKVELAKATIDDETIITSVNELARLNKIVSYLDGMIEGIDPELVPMSIWDNFNSQATACFQQIVNYNGNRNIGHIQEANGHADNLLTYIRPYMVTAEKIGTILQDAIKSYANTINEYGESFRNKSTELVEEIKGYTSNSKGLYDDIQATTNLIEQFNIELFGDYEVNDSIQNKVKKLVEQFEKNYETISEFYNETFIGNENNPSTKKHISQAKETILSEQKEIQDLLENVSTEVDDLNKFYEKIFGKFNDDNEQVGGLSGELDERIKALADFENKQVIKYDALIAKIDSLLPGATSAGLASAYRDMKLSFDDPIKNASRLFFGSISIIVLIAMLSTIDSMGLKDIERIQDGVTIHSTGMPYISFIQFSDWNNVLKELVSKIPFYAPILWLAFFASKRRSECQRLQQEYAHKEALAKSYDKYKKQIDELDV